MVTQLAANEEEVTKNSPMTSFLYPLNKKRPDGPRGHPGFGYVSPFILSSVFERDGIPKTGELLGYAKALIFSRCVRL